MSKKAVQFVIALSKDPQAMEDFAKDPDAVMDKYDLSPEDREVLKSGDVERIRKHLGEQGPPGCFVFLA